MIEGATLTLVETLDDVLDMMAWLGERREFLAVDVETTGLNVGRDVIRLAQLGDPTHGWAVPYRDWRGAMREAIERYDRPIVTHNLLFDAKFLKADGIVIPQHLAHDTMIMGHLLNPMARMGLKALAAKHVDRRADVGSDALKRTLAACSWDWSTVPVDHPSYWLYSAYDAVLTSALAEELWPRISIELRRPYELEVACIHVLRDAEVTGMAIDLGYCDAARAKLDAEIEVLRPQLPCNPNSEKQLVAYLQSVGAPLNHVTERGNISTDDEVLRELESLGFEVAATIRTFRGKSRLVSNYFETFAALHVDGVLRPSTRPVGARTGRMSVTEPALQTLPRGRVVRDAFVARPEHSLVLADFRGMEMRVMASDAPEPEMIEAYRRGEDVHDFTAAQLFGPDFTRKQRQVCKNAGFAKIYGAGERKFATTAGVSVADAHDFLARYDLLFTGVGPWQKRLIEGVQATVGAYGRRVGYVGTYGGRRLPVEVDAAYKAANYRVQGTCAEVMKEKLVELDSAGLGPAIRLAVHDEVIMEVPDEQVDDAIATVHDVMPDRTTFDVVLEVETKVVRRWGEAYADEWEAYVEAGSG